MESMHKELKSEWGADKVDVKHPRYGENLKKTVVRINGKTSLESQLNKITLSGKYFRRIHL